MNNDRSKAEKRTSGSLLTIKILLVFLFISSCEKKRITKELRKLCGTYTGTMKTTSYNGSTTQTYTSQVTCILNEADETHEAELKFDSRVYRYSFNGESFKI